MAQTRHVDVPSPCSSSRPSRSRIQTTCLKLDRRLKVKGTVDVVLHARLQSAPSPPWVFYKSDTFPASASDSAGVCSTVFLFYFPLYLLLPFTLLLTMTELSSILRLEIRLYQSSNYEVGGYTTRNAFRSQASW